MPRMKPYTAIGVRRLKCFRCGKRARYQWQIGSDGLVFRPICEECDVELNEMVLKWMGFPDWQEKMAAYIEKVREG
jgi:hypothetical protein